MIADRPGIETRNLGVSYGNAPALRDVSLALPGGQVSALIGPSGCGKSTFLRCLNRMNDEIPGAVMTGQVLIGGTDIMAPEIDPVAVRTGIGQVFQKPNPFPKSIYDNIAWGLRLHALAGNSHDEAAQVEDALARAGLWDEVKDRLDAPAMALSGGQQQRLCIARAIAVRPAVLLMDEPCSALDPRATEKIETLVSSLSKAMTIVIVTHNLAQAKRVADVTAFFHEGELVETALTQKLFENPEKPQTSAYITGKYG